MQNANVTNCPIATPFFDGKKCISCEGEYPIFNMETEKCDHCIYDTKLDSTKRSCEQIPHYTNYSIVDNYLLDGAK